MQRDLNEREHEFISEALLLSAEVELNSKNEIQPIEHKPQRKNTKPRKNNGIWIITLLTLPFLFLTFIGIITIRAESYFSGSLDWLIEQESKNDLIQILSDNGLTWLPSFIDLYAQRWTAVIIVFIVCFVIAGTAMYVNLKHNLKNTEES